MAARTRGLRTCADCGEVYPAADASGRWCVVCESEHLRRCQDCGVLIARHGSLGRCPSCRDQLALFGFGAGGVAVLLICEACQDAWEPELIDPLDQGAAMSTGCRRCGGWTWVGELSESSGGASRAAG